MRSKPAKRLAVVIERVAQRVYDVRDSVPARDLQEWTALDRIAGRLSRLGARYRKRAAEPTS